MTKKIVTLSGDGIGPEIMAAGLEVLEKVASKIGFDYDIDAKPFGGAGIDAEGHPLPKSTLDAANTAFFLLLQTSQKRGGHVISHKRPSPRGEGHNIQLQ